MHFKEQVKFMILPYRLPQDQIKASQPNEFIAWSNQVQSDAVEEAEIEKSQSEWVGGKHQKLMQSRAQSLLFYPVSFF